MRFQNHQTTTTIDNFHTEHILEKIERISSEPEVRKHLLGLAEVIKTRLSSPEAALIFRILHEDRYFTSPKVPKSLEEILLGGVLYREQEQTTDYSPFGILLNDYKVNEIKQCLNMSFLEYMSLTTYEKEECDKFARKWSEQVAKIMQQSEKESNSRIQDMKESFAKSGPQGPSMDDLEEFM